MRRAVLAIGGTAVGLAVLLSFKSHSLAAAAPAPAPSTPATASPAPAKPAATRTITGPATTTRYGLMQVKVTMVGQQITRVTVVQRAGDGTQTRRIASLAIPKAAS
jgi:uncharacterized protein with FMN-binding domain